MEQGKRIDSLLELLKTETNDVFLNYVLGIEYAAIGKTDEAKDQFIKVILLDENYIAVYYQMGKLFEKANDTAAAIDYYKKGAQKAKEKGDRKSAGEFEEAIFMLED
jgi:tetratricopeptide (TPR) repeat protein